MPEATTLEKAKQDLREGKSPTTAAGEFVHEEMEHIREGKHGARSTKQAIAIGLSKARRAGVPLPPPKAGTVSEKTRRASKRAYDAGQGAPHTVSRKRGKAALSVLKHEPRRAASRAALSKHAKQVAARKRQQSRSRKIA